MNNWQFSRIGLVALMMIGVSGTSIARQYGDAYDDAAGYGVDTLETRVERIEKRLSGHALADLVTDIDKLQAEVQKLRGELEKANHELDKLRKQHKEDYASMDQRVQQIATAQAQAAAAAAAPPAAATPTDPNATPVDPNAAVTPAATDPAAQASATPAAPAAQPAPPPPPPPPAVSSREADYQKAFGRLKEGKYADAIRDFKAFLGAYPTGEFSDNAQYWLAEAYYVTKDMGSAHDAFRGVLANYPQSTKTSDAMLKIGYIEYETGQYGTAREVLSDLVKRYPSSSAAKLAEKRLDKMRQEGR